MLRQALLSCRTPLTQSQRYRGKINIQRPRQPHYDRALVLAVTRPRLPEPPKNRECFKKIELSKVENPYNDIIAREVRNWLHHSQFVGIFHLNPIKQNELFKVRVQLHKYNMTLKSYGKKIIAKAVQDTRYEAIVPLFDSFHCMVFSPEPQVLQLLRIVRKVPQMVLMAGIVNNKLLSRNELVEYAQLPNLQLTQAELVQTLNMAAGNLVRQLETHQNSFVNILDVHAKADIKDGTTDAVTVNTAKE